MNTRSVKLPEVAPSEPNVFDHFLKFGSIGILVCLWVLLGMYYQDLPESVPMHFDASGQPDRFGDKAELIMLPALATLMYGFMFVLSKFPRHLNYPVQVTPENAAHQYRLGLRLIGWLQFSIPLLFGVGMLEIMSISLGQGAQLGSLFLPLMVGLVLLPVAYFVWKAFQYR